MINKIKNLGKFMLLIASLYSLLLISSCNTPKQQTLEIPTAETNSVALILTQMAVDQKQPEPPDVGVPNPTGTVPSAPEDPAKTLRVCLGSEPESLFLYKSSSRATWAVLEALYDGPFDRMNGKEEATLFEDVLVDQSWVPVQTGDMVMNNRGEPQMLSQEMSTSNAACEAGSVDCLPVLDGTTPNQMLQVKITFQLREGLKWSDGQPLTAHDSVFSWELAGNNALPVSRYFSRLTQRYEALDDRTVVWTGIPGFNPQQLSDVFWVPLPKHTMEGMEAAALLSDDIVNRRPLGWGAYQVSEWKAGEEIVLARNPNYLSANSEENPFFERVVYRFYGEAGDNSLMALRDGACDVIDLSVNLLPELEPILEDVRDEKIAAYIQPQPSWEQLTLNLLPASNEMISIFKELPVRQALTACLDREALIRQVYYGQSEIPIGFYPAAYDEKALSASVTETENGPLLLEAAGWIDDDNDPATARISKGVSGIPDGTPLAFELIASDSNYRQKTAEIIRDQLAECGVDVTVKTDSVAKIYATGPEGSIFGRSYQAALLAWSAGAQNPCSLFTAAQIPTESNRWIGTNVSGFLSEKFDLACTAARSGGIHDSVALDEMNLTVQELFTAELPAIPLYFHPTIAVSSLNICGVRNGGGIRSILWNIEDLSKSETPCAVSQWRDIYTVK